MRISRYAFTFLGLFLLMRGGAAWAQAAEDVEALTEPVAEGEASEGDVVEEIVVTGSRLRRDAFSSASPITVITSERSALAGLLDTAEILQGSSIASGQQIDDSFSGFVTDGGPGANTLSLRGLGAQRTLILVNGKRWGPSGVRGAVNSADLSTIPSSVVQRIEILKDGASSVYGADAVAGVVNIITKERQDGFQLNVSGALPFQGGAENYVLDAVWGKIGDDYSFNIAASYDVQEQLTRSNRDWAACDRRPRITDQDGDGTIDNRDPETGEELCFGAVYGFAVSPFGWARYDPSLGPNADPETPGFDPTINGAFGIPYYTRVPETPLDNSGEYYRDARDPNIAQIVPKSELLSVTAFADKDLSLFDRSAKAYLEFYYNQRETEANGGYRQFFPVVPGTSPHNPFGVYGPLGALGVFAARPVMMSYNLLDPAYYVDVERTNTFAGLSGDISGSWGFDMFVGYSHSSGTYKKENWLQDRVDASLDATLDADGNVVCRDLQNFPGCVPGNLFTEDALLQGTLPSDYLAYISKYTKGKTTYESLQFSGYVTGDLFEIWQDEAAQLVFGVEVRREEIDDVPDIDAQNDNIWGSTTAAITAGSDVVREAFLEFEMPLLPLNTPFAEEVLVNLAARYTDYNSYGDDLTERAQLNWQVNPLLRLRGSYGTSFRAPDLYEQFLGDQTGFLQYLLDPCVDYGTDSEPGDPVYVNCMSLGLPPDHGSDGGPGIRSITGGNPDLQAETSESWTAGVVLTPEELGLSVSLNYYSIKLENEVASPSVGYVLSQCYNSTGLSDALCSRIGPRDADGFLTDVDASLLNIGVQKTKGVDVDILYEREFSRFDLAIDFTATYIDEQYFELFDQEYHIDGRWGFPYWSGELNFYLDWRDWRFLWGIDYVGPTAESPVFDPDTTNVDRINETKARHYHTLSARYTSPDDWQVIATVRNLFDKDPPIVSDGQGSNSATRVFNTLPGVGYRLLGRTFVLQVSKAF